jgi:hypothetical protein
LPHCVDETTTITVALKIRLAYRNAYQTRKVLAFIVLKALKQLCSRQIYKYENICININWNQILESNNEEMMETTNNESESEATKS